MPELPEVEVVVQHLHTHILGAKIEALTIHRSDIVRTGHDLISWFQQAKLTNVHRVGKCVVMTCQRAQKTRYLLSELGMTGLWFFKSNLTTSPQHIHCQVTLSGTNTRELHYWNPRRFGRLWLFEASETGRPLFSADSVLMPITIDRSTTFEQASSKNSWAVKTMFLLNQHHLAGIGNIYANEILFRANVHPHAKGYQLRRAITTASNSIRPCKTVLQEAITAGGSSIRDFRAPDGSHGHFQESHIRSTKRTAMPCPHGCSNLH